MDNKQETKIQDDSKLVNEETKLEVNEEEFNPKLNEETKLENNKEIKSKEEKENS